MYLFFLRNCLIEKWKHETSLVFNMANGGAIFAFLAVVAAVGLNLSMHKIEEGMIMKSRTCSSKLDSFARASCVVGSFALYNLLNTFV